MRDGVVARSLGCDVVFQPEPQSIETPGGGPPEQWAEYQPIHELSGKSRAGAVVEAGEKSNARLTVGVGPGQIAPVAGPRLDQRFAVRRPKLQPGPARTVRAVAVADRLTGAGDLQARREPRAVSESSRLAGLARGVRDLTEPQVLAPVQKPILSGRPQVVERAINPRLHVDRSDLAHAPTVAVGGLALQRPSHKQSLRLLRNK